MSELAKGLSKMVLTLTVKTGEEGKLFGAVTPGAIADEMKHQFDVAIDKRKIHLEHPIKTLGEHAVELRLHAEVVATLKIRVESSTPAPKPSEPAVAEARPEGEDKADRRRERPGRKPRAEKRDKPG
jgi:large subunit ribosomal protein L9